MATRSGRALVVDFRLDGSLARDVTLTGDARVVFEGTPAALAAAGTPTGTALAAALR